MREPSLIVQILALLLLAAFLGFMKWLGKKAPAARRQPTPYPAAAAEKESIGDHNPGGPLSARQAQALLEWVLQAAIRQGADAIFIDSLAGRPQVRLRLDGTFQELTGIGDAQSYRLLVASARLGAGLPATAGAGTGRGSFHRFYRPGHLRNAGMRIMGQEISYAFQETARRGRSVRFDLESYPGPAGETLKITVRRQSPAEVTRFGLGFNAAAEEQFIRAVRSHSGIVLLTGPCNCGKSTATYHALSLLRDEGRKIIAVEWPREGRIDGIVQYHLHDLPDVYDAVGKCLRRAIRRRPDVLMLQNIDWVDDDDAKAAIDFAAAGGLLLTAVHVAGCASGLANLVWRHFGGRRQEVAGLLKAVVSPRRLFMVCAHCAEAYPVPAKVLVDSGMSDPPVGADGLVATWRGSGCPLCENTGELGSTAVYEVLDLGGEMNRFIHNANDWYFDQVEYLERQAWLHGMRCQRELALERVIAGDISLQQALLNTRKPRWLDGAQGGRDSPRPRRLP